MEGAFEHLDIELTSGRRCKLGDLCAEGPLALVFLRHLGCIFCREHVGRLAAEAPHDRIYLVAMADAETGRQFLRGHPTPHAMICDPERHLFQAFGLERGTLGQLLGPKVWARGAKAFAAGYRQGRPLGDPAQLPGSFVLDQNARIVWSHLAKHAADTTEPSVLSAMLRAQSASASKP
ncbi:MAG: peroxiredoxin-like family protein [Fimbriimonadales bacterium]